ncbi:MULTISPECIES: ShlB/FhaC/HecB family hemolysin secretion/activation protein [Herbaspirillum]|uniref:ShlB/FhaC/HecB family hemolysin secretion/activation protein n=1 Tax=Herbaspirillum rubrisubalbicans Os34 TaxID=1235827 RepID=A0A6M3ZQY2_9BURK|nr:MULTISPECIES: POTRA domain-containing protein [Herbaspirillum]QJP99841.1 ShlB/FhaC/HecB family hemolysin secretion/activation protein [Herbaspirillum rubrisubalbicans Os34]
MGKEILKRCGQRVLAAIGAGCVLFACFSQEVRAQSVSPAMGGASVEELQRGVNPRRVGGISSEGAVTVPSISEENPVDEKDKRTIYIKGFRLVGQTVFDEATLLGIAKASPGQYTFGQLEKMARAITTYYRDRGYLVGQAVIPAQKSKDGVIEIRIVEGRLESEASITAQDEDVQKAIRAIYHEVVCAKVESDPQASRCEGVVATDRLVERIVLLAREQTGMKVFGSLSPGTQQGYTHLSLNALYGKKIVGEASFDNSGSSSTGKQHLQGHMVVNSLFAVGDSLDLLLGTSNKPSSYKFFQADYSLPVGAKGWRVGLNLGQTEYYLGSGFSALGANGVSRSVGSYAKYPLLLSSNARTDLTFSAKVGQLKDNNLAFSNPRLYWQTSADLAGRFEDTSLGTPAITLWGAHLDRGGVRITDSNQQAVDSATYQTAGSFDRLSLRGSREQGLGGRWSAYFSGTGTAGDKNMDSYFKFGLGGPYGVRAYPSGEASGDQGVLGTFELRYAADPFDIFSHSITTRVAAFYDRGWVKINASPLAGTRINSYVRAGAGVQLEVTDTDRMGLRIFWATPVGTGPSTSDGASSRVGILTNLVF